MDRDADSSSVSVTVLSKGFRTSISNSRGHKADPGYRRCCEHAASLSSWALIKTILPVTCIQILHMSAILSPYITTQPSQASQMTPYSQPEDEV